MTEFEARTQIIEWIKNDEYRLTILQTAQRLNLNDWCIGAGFVRNFVWDKINNKSSLTKLNDVDLVYYDENDLSSQTDIRYEDELKGQFDVNWSVKNQARMHIKNNATKYISTADAMSYWPELETAVGIRLNGDGIFELVAPFGVSRLFDNTITMNERLRNKQDFHDRIKNKRWLQTWTALKIISS